MIRPLALLLLVLTLHAADPGILHVRVLHQSQATPARVNVIGPDNAFYQPAPQQNPLAAYNLSSKGNRNNVGPLRYQGSFFYTEGEFTLTLPPGNARIEVSKGYAFYRNVVDAVIASGKTTTLEVTLQPLLDLPAAGWRATDTHLHFKRETPEDDRTIATLLAAEGIDLGYIMTQASASGYGASSLFRNRGVVITSGEEIVNSALGHINILMADRPTIPRPDGPIPEVSAPRASLPLATLYDRAKAANGAIQHNHAGYEQEILADVVLHKSDWVELLQFGSYRPKIGLADYYLLLNSGFRYPLAGGSDYPVCRALADSMTYIASGPALDPRAGTQRLIRGEAFATSGPMLFLSVNGKGPGTDIEFTGATPRTVDVSVVAASADLPITSLEIVQDGKVAAEWHSAEPAHQKTLTAKLRVTASSWIAARAAGPQTAHAHTNPVWVLFDRRPPFHPEAAAELLDKLKAFSPPRIGADAQKVLDDAKASWANGPAPWPAAISPTPTNLAPKIAHPPARHFADIRGIVVDAEGHPIPGATVTAKGTTAQTGANGKFLLHAVDTQYPPSLQVSMPGRVTTNSAYFNPKSGPTKIVLLSDIALPALIIDRRQGRTVTHPKISLQDADPRISNPHEPNLIVPVSPGRDMVAPVYPGQATYISLPD